GQHGLGCRREPLGVDQMEPAGPKQTAHDRSQATAAVHERSIHELNPLPGAQLTPEGTEALMGRPDEREAIALVLQGRIVVEDVGPDPADRPARHDQDALRSGRWKDPLGIIHYITLISSW